MSFDFAANVRVIQQKTGVFLRVVRLGVERVESDHHIFDGHSAPEGGQLLDRYGKAFVLENSEGGCLLSDVHDFILEGVRCFVWDF